MQGAFEIGLWFLIALVGVPVIVFTLEVVLAMLPAARVARSAERPGCVVLIPAHNEAGLIAQTVRSVRRGLIEHDRVLVVADNCSDETAAEARAAGAEVVERDDQDHRGKGYALGAGVAAIAGDPPAIVVVLDADCEPEPGCIDTLVRACVATGRPAQASYLMRPPVGGGVGDRVSALAFRFKNLVRPRGLARLGGPCLLTGSGMAFTYEQLRESELATGDIVEDMRLGVDLALAGAAPVAVPGAIVWSVLPGADDAKRTQRTRWEHGHITSILVHTPRLVASGVRRGRVSLFLLALELAVPPMSLLVLASAAVAALSAGSGLIGVPWGPALGACGLLALVVLAGVLGWARFGRGTLRARDLIYIPVYTVGKVPIYCRALTGRQKTWVRTARDPTDPDACTR